MSETGNICPEPAETEKNTITKMNLKVRLALLNFLEFAVWGAYLTSMGTYLGKIGMASQIGWFYAVQGVVSIFMPALMGIVADRWVPAQRLLGFCHLMLLSSCLAQPIWE